MQHKSSECHSEHACHPPSGRPDFLLWGSLVVIIIGIFLAYFGYFARGFVLGSLTLPNQDPSPYFVGLVNFGRTITDLMIKMSWGLIFAIGFVGILDFVPRSKFHQVLGRSGGVSGVARATLAGVLLDLCSHGILLVGMKLYERGASLGQVVAFLVASPWNSFSMTLILWSLIGLPLTLIFILLSCVIAILSGFIFEVLEKKKVLPPNPNSENFKSGTNEPWFNFPQNKGFFELVGIALKSSLHESKMILRWIFFGVILTAAVKELISPESFQAYFGPDTVGVLLTLVSATILEVCSEGSAPLASELVVTAKAPGNAFTFLMAGVSTDYTEILALKETTKSWKIAFFLPLVTLPQIIVIGILMNKVGF